MLNYSFHILQFVLFCMHTIHNIAKIGYALQILSYDGHMKKKLLTNSQAFSMQICKNNKVDDKFFYCNSHTLFVEVLK